MWGAAKCEWEECIAPVVSGFDSSAVEFPPELFCWDSYLRARAIVTSRAFAVDDAHGVGLVPLADLFNHVTGAQSLFIFFRNWFRSGPLSCVLILGLGCWSGNRSKTQLPANEGFDAAAMVSVLAN